MSTQSTTYSRLQQIHLKLNTNLEALQHQMMGLSSILQIVQQCHSHQPPPEPLPSANHS